jgi:hypothetical protein
VNASTHMASASTVPLAERVYDYTHGRAFGYTLTFCYLRPFLPAVNLSLRNQQQPGWSHECDATITFL